MTRKEFVQTLLQVVAYYAAGVHDGTYEDLMDRLTNTVSDAQWEEVTATLELVDAWLGPTDAATTYQREKWLASQQGRRSRYPGALDLRPTAELAALKAALRVELGTERDR